MVRLRRRRQKWKKACETAKFMAYNTTKDTGGLLNALRRPRALAAHNNYGADEWWLLLPCLRA